MRKMIIDTDTGSDDAVALALGLLANHVEILGITTVSGNCDLEQATLNALMTVEKCGKDTPVYKGCSLPLLREKKIDAVAVHGDDGMGDLDLIHPTQVAQDKHGVDFIIEMVKEYPNEVEIAIIGPATNIALAIMKEPLIMKQVKHYYIMGTGGFALGNASTMAEFNVYADAESYVPLLRSDVSKTIIGFDVCIANTFVSEEIEILRHKNDLGKFLMDANETLLNYNIKRTGEAIIDLPDAVALAVALWPEDIVLNSKEVYASVAYKEPETYGLVMMHDRTDALAVIHDYPKNNATVIKEINGNLFKEKVMTLI